MTDRSSARAAKERLRSELGPLPGVGGIGIGRRDGSYVVTVDVVDESDLAQVPASWDGVDVEARVVGRVVPLPATGARGGTATARAARPGTVARPGAAPSGPAGPGGLRTGRAVGSGMPWGSSAQDAGGTAP